MPAQGLNKPPRNLSRAIIVTDRFAEKTAAISGERFFERFNVETGPADPRGGRVEQILRQPAWSCAVSSRPLSYLVQHQRRIISQTTSAARRFLLRRPRIQGLRPRTTIAQPFKAVVTGINNEQVPTGTKGAREQFCRPCRDSAGIMIL